MTPQQIKPLQSPAILVQDNQSSAAKSSILYTMIPVAVKARLPKIPSLRKSRSASSFDQAKELLPSHSRRPVSADLSECETLLDDSALSSLQPCKPSTDPVLARSKPEATASWKYANQGLALLENAVAESRDPTPENQTFARQLYLHSLTYLFQGIPSNLSAEERSSLYAAIPNSLHFQPQYCYSRRYRPNSEPSLLHRLLASGIVQLFLLASFLLPYLRLFLCSAYKYERQHHVSEKLFAASVDAVDRIGRKSMDFVGLVFDSGNGRVGMLLQSFLAWCVEGIAGGVHDGVGEGLAIMAARRAELGGDALWDM